ncbi:hypothetical protein PoB_001513000 [Plakobranchus ocellatus]|uniref:Uncharacterized protein n=1 Tax=Plakobranchus ocellatus TaxID=259542 RepID=A0AAV3YZN1_9GAST|nr:hypothetical protein PoB_001513000 [Plakobranchus ocellatus]
MYDDDNACQTKARRAAATRGKVNNDASLSSGGRALQSKDSGMDYQTGGDKVTDRQTEKDGRLRDERISRQIKLTTDLSCLQHPVPP